MANLTLKDLGIVPFQNGQMVRINENTLATQPYTSMAGNTYFSAVSILSNIIIKQDIGIGWLHTFLNGLRLYARSNGVLIAEQNYHCQIYYPNLVVEESCRLFMKAVRDMARRQNVRLDEQTTERVFRSEVAGYLAGAIKSPHLLR